MYDARAEEYRGYAETLRKVALRSLDEETDPLGGESEA
jgi:hypothetical protein